MLGQLNEHADTLLEQCVRQRRLVGKPPVYGAHASDPKERGKAFGVYGAIAGGGALVGLLLGGLLTEYLDWRWCLYVNLVFAGVAVVGAFLFLSNERSAHAAHLDIFGVLTVSGSML